MQSDHSENQSNQHEYQQLTPPIRQNVFLQTSKGKKLKTINYKCPYCQKTYLKQITRIRKHMFEDCRIRRNCKLALQNFDANQQNLIPQPINSSFLTVEGQNKKEKKKIKVLQKFIMEMKVEIAQIRNKPLQNFAQKSQLSKNLSKEIWSTVSEAIRNHMEYKIYQQIENTIQNISLSPQMIKGTFTANLVQNIIGIKMNGLLTTFNQKLKESIDEILSQMVEKCSQTKSRIKTSAQFLMNYSQYQLTVNHRKLLEDLRISTNYRRSNVVLLYSRLMRKYPPLSLKPLPSNIQVYSFVAKRQIIDIQSIKDLVRQFWNNNQKVLACDIFFSLVFGLRRSELTRIHFQKEQKKFYPYLKIYQRKNQNITMRLVPQTLILMTAVAKVTYPITLERFQTLRSTCLSKIGQFYGLRHVCLTHLTATLLKHSQLSIHKNTATTINRYIDIQALQHVNQVFQLEQFSKLKKNILFQYVDQFLFFEEKQVVAKKIESSQKIEAKIQLEQQEEELQDKIYDASISSNIEPEFYHCSQVSQGQKTEIRSSQEIFQQYSQELLPDNMYSSVEVLNAIVQKSNLPINEIIEKREESQAVASYKTQLQCLGKHMKTNIRTIEFHCLNKEVKTKQIQNFKFNEEVPLIISKTQQKFRISENLSKINTNNSLPQIHDNPPQNRRMSLRKKNPSSQSFFTYFNILVYCTKCFMAYLELIMRDQTNYLRCSKCKHQTQKIPRNKQLGFREVNFLPETMKRSKEKLESIKQVDKLNNLKQTVQARFGKNTYVNRSLFSGDLPRNIKTSSIFYSCFTQNQIAYNRDFQDKLPLRIKESGISEAGMGLFTETDIKDNTIIITYEGVIKPHFQVDFKNDSLYTVGCLIAEADQSDPIQLLIEPKQYLNAGRYINTNDSSKTNAEPILGLISKNSNSSEICLLIKSKKFIPAGSEIFYDYGDTYRIISREE